MSDPSQLSSPSQLSAQPASRPHDLNLRLQAYATGVVAVAALIALVGYFLFGDAITGVYTRWTWLGPASDVLTIVLVVPMSILAVVVAVRVRSAVVVVLAVLVVAGQVALGWTTLLMLAGSFGFEVQFAVSIPAVAAMFGWTLAASVVGARRGTLGAGMSRWGMIMALAALAGTAVFGVGLLLGGAAQVIVFSVGGAAGAAAWAAFPFWCVALAYRWRSQIRSSSSVQASLHPAISA